MNEEELPLYVQTNLETVEDNIKGLYQMIPTEVEIGSPLGDSDDPITVEVFVFLK